MKVFLEIAVGDAAHFAEQSAAHERAAAFLAAVGVTQLGLPSTLVRVVVVWLRAWGLCLRGLRLPCAADTVLLCCSMSCWMRLLRLLAMLDVTADV